MAKQSGSHSFFFGGDLTRFQLNGIESNNSRGYFQFTNNFGRGAIQNLRLGTPSLFEGTIGELGRGFRNWSGGLYFADRWKVSPALLYYGLRYGVETAPVEVQARSIIPYDCDCNNFSPRLGISLQLPKGWLLRTSGAVSFAAIQPVTYQQVRNNLPLVKYIQIQNPNLVNPLLGLDLQGKDTRVSPIWLSPDLTSAYAWQYNMLLEKRIAGFITRTGYIGSRSFKLVNSFVTNRADLHSSLPLTVETIDARRADQHYYEIKNILNAGIAYFDAAFFTLDLPLRRGLTVSATYTFSKAIDEGSDFTSTAANKDLLSAAPRASSIRCATGKV